METTRKTTLLIFLGIAAAAILLLSSGISQLELREGSRVMPALPTSQAAVPPPGERAYAEPEEAFSYVATAIIYALVIFSLVYALMSPQARKLIFRRLLWVVAVAGIALLLAYRLADRLGLEIPQLTPPGSRSETPEFVEFVGGAPGWLSFIVSLALVLLASGVAWYFWKQGRTSEDTIELVNREARQALSELQSGADFKNTIIRCYYEMSQAVKLQRGVSREEAMTPREFEKTLQEVGLPGGPVKELTRLFERARYGQAEPSPQEQQQAIHCLKTIREAGRR